jgi:hypothetical protein
MRDWLGTPLRHRLVKDSGFLSFEDARTFARSLGLTSGKEWEAYCRSGARPRDIPGSPDSLYRDQGWAGIKDWLGAPPRYRFRTFEDARSYVWTLGIKSQAEWSKYCKSGGRPSDIPATPRGVYRHRGWADWGDWLGTGYVSVSKQNFWSYEDAKDFVWTLGIKTTREWLRYAKSAKRPAYIPISPHMVYKDKGWAGVGDWLGTGIIAHQNREWAPFKEARAFVRSLNLTVGWRESHYRPGCSRRGINLIVVWREYCKSGERPVNIPTDPARIYRDKGWADMRDWLGK